MPGKTESKLNWDVSKTIYIATKGDGGLYAKQYADACEMIEQVVEFLGSASPGGNDIRISHGNTVVGISGERGTGKTSFLHSLMKMIPDNVFPLGCVEPSEFESKMSALELFLAQLYSNYIDIQNESDKSSDIYASPRIHKTFKDISKRLSALRVNESVYNNENPGIEILHNMVELTDMREKIGQLCKDFLEMLNTSGRRKRNAFECLALFIDDADLIKNDCIYKLLEDIRKYLSGNLIVVISFRQSQLLDSVCDHLIGENKQLLDRGFLSVDALRSQTEDFVEKVVPRDRTIHLFDQADLMNRRVREVFRALSDSDEDIRKELIDPYLSSPNVAVRPRCPFDSAGGPTVAEWVDGALYSRTLVSITPVNDQENVPYLWPRNLRELMTLARILQVEMEDPWQSVNDFAACKDNLKKYRAYFIGNLVEAFSPAMVSALNRWLTASAQEKNYAAYAEFFKLLYLKLEQSTKYPGGNGIVSKQSIFENLLSVDLMYPDNITFGDVYTIIGKYIDESFDSSLDVYFGYSFKMLYSIELLSCLLELFLDDTGAQDNQGNNDALANYLALLNSALLPPELTINNLVQLISIPKGAQYDDFMKKDSEEVVEEDESPSSDEPLEHIELNLEEYKNILNWITSPKVVFAGEVFTSSRPKRKEQGINDPREYDDGSRNPFRSNYNRSLYLPSRNSLPSANKLGNGDYSVCLLDILANPAYIEQLIARKCGYAFYSPFDLDVFVKLTYDEKRGKTPLIDQMMRINTALAQATADTDVLAKANFDNDASIKYVSIPYEIELFKRIKAPFVEERDGSFRLFITAENGIIPTFWDFKKAFEASIAMERIKKNEKEARSLAVMALFDEPDKRRVADYLDILAQRLLRRGQRSEANEMRRLCLTLREARTQFSPKRKERVEEIMRKWPYEAEAAYREWI